MIVSLENFNTFAKIYIKIYITVRKVSRKIFICYKR